MYKLVKNQWFNSTHKRLSDSSPVEGWRRFCFFEFLCEWDLFSKSD